MKRLVAIFPALVLTLALQPPADAVEQAQPAKRASGMLALVGGMLITGHGGEPIHHSVVLVEKETIKAIGTVDSLKVPAGARVIDARGKTVMPGLIDMHSHSDIVGAGVYDSRFFGAAPVVPEGGWHPLSKARFKEFVGASEKHQLMAGVTMAREVGGFLDADLYIRDAINRGEIQGSRRLVSGPWINYGDPALTDKLFHTINVNTAEGARAAAINLLDVHKVDLIKAYNNLEAGMVKAIVEEAHKRGKHVASHVRGHADLAMRIAAGIDSMEHMGATTGDRYTAETLDLLASSRLAVGTDAERRIGLQGNGGVPGKARGPRRARVFPS